MYIAIRTDDGRKTGKISFYCNTLQVSRQAFYDYLGRKGKLWKYQPLADAMLKIHDEDEENADYGRVRMYQALKYGKEVGKLKATPHKARKKTLHVINLQSLCGVALLHKIIKVLFTSHFTILRRELS